VFLIFVFSFFFSCHSIGLFLLSELTLYCPILFYFFCLLIFFPLSVFLSIALFFYTVATGLFYFVQYFLSFYPLFVILYSSGCVVFIRSIYYRFYSMRTYC
jgi:hypothetical protein